MSNEFLIPAIALPLFLAWSLPFLFVPLWRSIAQGVPLGVGATTLLYLFFSSLIAVTISLPGDDWPIGILVLALVPLLPLALLLEVVDAVHYGLVPIFATGLLLWIAGLVFISRFNGHRRLALAVTLPMLITSGTALMQANRSDAEMVARFHDLGGDCLDASGFLVSFRQQTAAFHAVARKGNQYYVWSYRLRGHVRQGGVIFQMA